MQAQPLGPINYSKFERTGNISIDLIAQTIGYHKSIGHPLYSITLSHGRWLLFVEGMRVLHHMQGKPFDRHSEFTFEGVFICEGSRLQLDPMRYVYKVGAVKN